MEAKNSISLKIPKERRHATAPCRATWGSWGGSGGRRSDGQSAAQSL